MSYRCRNFYGHDIHARRFTRRYFYYGSRSVKIYSSELKMRYEVDPLRQGIAESWPNSLDDTCARSEWDWAPNFSLDEMTKDMIAALRKKFNK